MIKRFVQWMARSIVRLIVRPTGVTWGTIYIEFAIAVLEKITLTQQAGLYLPLPVFECHVGGKKNVSTEVVVRDVDGNVYLIQRPSSEESPEEPFPDMWHSPGVTHVMTESTDDTIRRLVEREFCGV